MHLRKSFYRDQDAANAAGGAAAPIDVAALKAEILETNKAMIETVTGSLMTQFKGMLDAKTPEPAARSSIVVDDMDDFRAEIEDLGLDDKMSKAMFSLMEKFASKKAPTLKKEIRTEVDSDQNDKAIKQQANYEAALQYPDATNPASPLHKLAVKHYNEMSVAAQADPKSMAKCVALSAAILGIAPMSLAELKRKEASNPTGGGSGSDGDGPKKFSEAEKDFGEAFGIDPKVYEKNLKMVRNKKVG